MTGSLDLMICRNYTWAIGQESTWCLSRMIKCSSFDAFPDIWNRIQRKSCTCGPKSLKFVDFSPPMQKFQRLLETVTISKKSGFSSSIRSTKNVIPSCPKTGVRDRDIFQFLVVTLFVPSGNAFEIFKNTSFWLAEILAKKKGFTVYNIFHYFWGSESHSVFE